MNDQNKCFNKNRIIAAAAGIALCASLAVVPAIALATSEGAAQTNQTTTDTGQENASNGKSSGKGQKRTRDASSLTGLTDDERTELQKLYDKRSELAKDEKLSDEDRTRMKELEEKGFLTTMKEKLTADEYTEFEQLHQKDESVKAKVKELYEKEGLTDEEQERLDTLEEKGGFAHKGGHGAHGGGHQRNADNQSTGAQDTSNQANVQA